MRANQRELRQCAFRRENSRAEMVTSWRYRGEEKCDRRQTNMKTKRE
jgi:hypothetical protein